MKKFGKGLGYLICLAGAVEYHYEMSLGIILVLGGLSLISAVDIMYFGRR